MTDHPTGLQGFEILGKLGEGAFAEVYRVRRKQDGQLYALKKIRLTRIKDKQRDNALNQVRILASESSRHIIDYKQAFFDQPSNSLCIVMELAAKGDLLQLVHTHAKNRTSIPESLIWKALVHIGQGLRSLHARKILHRDLKCANIFMTADGVFKLGDLNVSKVLKQDLAKTQTGTPYYASPEVWKDRPYGIKSDMWSLGCILYEMAAQKPPFSAGDLQGLYKKIVAGIFPRIPASYSDDLAKVISSLLKLDPQNRPSATELLSSPIVLNRCDAEEIEEIEAAKNELLETIVMNHRNFKSIHNVLPKPNYEGKSKPKESQESAENDHTKREKKRVQSVAEPIISKLLEAARNNSREIQSRPKRDRIISSICSTLENKTNIIESLELSRLPKIDTPATKRIIQATPTPLFKVIQQNSSVVASDRKASPKQTPSSSRVDILANSQIRRANKQNQMRGGEHLLAMKLQTSKENKQSLGSLAQKVIYPSWWMQ